mmetsp:Transcript_20419/g.26786  ORF Transcript_20419/g.26786 Transcript_20419/m.26786 type:complete len:299 (-) Transcript_20419:125-1021(-)|eukprot:CAMPEP_0195294276 /NCGR_PEP_ID=MMETSP0707-20130614/14537_1 /TAXON_ID=33640 /ORGANISM="Asterionellopsis glacialis, Strain CCMP134" /LENGTH=298 /DNA_ID=CAMNT_0040355201 /DNA_START=23 /DNA_END=919 /DNA_ORIENTATION=+
MKVAVLYGGNSAERDVSLKSGAAVFEAIQALGHEATLIDTADKDALAKLQSGGFDKAFPALHGRGGEDGVIQGVLDFLEIPYCGSGVLASALAMDKFKSKQVLMTAGVKVAEFELLNSNSDWKAIVDRLGLPLMVKPAREGSSVGINKAESVEELQQHFETALKYDDCIIAEQWLTGLEYSVAILANEALPAILLQHAEGTPFFDFETKYVKGTTKSLIPCGLSDEDEKKMQRLALEAFNQLNCRGWGRIDIMEHSGDFYVLEANTLPGMTKASLFQKAAAATGLDFNALVAKILETA